jgi:hypothetical protein
MQRGGMRKYGFRMQCIGIDAAIEDEEGRLSDNGDVGGYAAFRSYPVWHGYDGMQHYIPQQIGTQRFNMQ